MTERDGPAEADPSRLSARALATAIRAGRWTARGVVEVLLDRVARLDGDLHAFVTVAAETARIEADRLDAAARQGRFVGPLHGVPFAVKDLIDTAGIRTTRGSMLHRDHVPTRDDPVVARLKAAGGIVLGKTNTPEFGFGALCCNQIAGNTVNPFARDRTSGGSSGGAAVAVATGMVPVSLGTDFGGSVRTPASFCDVVGLRPGPGLLPRHPKSASWETLATPGLLTRDAADAAFVLQIAAGADRRDPTTVRTPPWRPAAGLAARPRVAATLDLGIATIAHDVADAFATAVARLKTTVGLEVDFAHPDFAGAQQAFETLRAAMLHHDFMPLLETRGEAISPTVRWNVERGAGLSADALLDAEATRARIYGACVDFFERYDFLVLPAASVAPFPLDLEDVLAIDGRPLRNIVDYLTPTSAISLVGLPALSLPAGFIDGRLPFGLQIVAPPGGEAELLAFAARLEREPGFGHAFG
ncbi:MAG: amidase [Phyllobacteriaceae bacterium]|nr:amidase [Phyllobacteriaceae bacterium]